MEANQTNSTHLASREPQYDYLIGQALLVHAPYDPDDRIYNQTMPWSNHSSIDNGFRALQDLNIPYVLFEILVAVFAIIGNAAVMIVFQQEKRLRRRTNYYIVSLALADFLVGLLGIPFAIMASVGLPRNLHACLCTVSLLIVLCTISIFCLVAVSVDRYWAILYCISYNRNVSTRTAICMISACWIAGTIVGLLPLFGWHADVPPDQGCLFVEIMEYSYLVFLYFATIITPAIILAGFYAHIYTVILRQLNHNVVSVKDDASSNKSDVNTRQLRRERGGTMLRVLGAAQKREVKATQNLSIIVLFFMICWIPLYTINFINAFCSMCLDDIKLTNFCIILSHLNSAVNPILYAYHLRDFRKALKTSMMRLCGMKIPEPEPKYRVSLISQTKNLINNSDSARRSTPRIYIGSNLRLQPKDSPSPRAKYSTHAAKINKLPNNSIVNLTVDTHCKIWQIVEAESPELPAKKLPTRRRIHSLGDVLSATKNKNFIVEYCSATEDEGYDSNDKSTSNNQKKLLFASHAQFSKEINLEDGAEENIILSEIDPSMVELLDDPETVSQSSFQLPSVKNEVFVTICGNNNGSKSNEEENDL